MPKVVHERADVLPALTAVFREHGYEGASLALIEERTRLGKGSLYHFFPGGKAEMASAVLADVLCWFRANVFQPLQDGQDFALAIPQIFAAVEVHFRSGNGICVVGAFSNSTARDSFRNQVSSYFFEWTEALSGALVRAGHDAGRARTTAEEVVAAIHGGLVIARALDQPAMLARTFARLEQRLLREVRQELHPDSR